MSQQSSSNESTGERPQSRQRLTPLFAVALALMCVGFYLAFTHEADVDYGGVEPPAFGELEPISVADEDVTTDIEPVNLVHAPAEAREVELVLRQKSRLEDASSSEDAPSLETIVELGLTEEVAEADATRFERERALAITRTYERAAAKVSTDTGEVIGAGITSQVEELLRGSVTRMVVAPSGEPLDFEWREVPNPQARRMLFLVRDAHTFLTPRFFAGAVNPGDTWSYKRPLSVEEADLGVQATGEVDIQNRFVGTIGGGDERRLAVVRQTLVASVSGTLEAEEGDSGFTLEGEGTGVVLVDIDAGRAHAVDVDLKRVLTVETGGESTVQTSAIYLGLRPTDGLSLPQPEEQTGDEDDALDTSTSN